MKNIRRIISLLLVLAMLVSCLGIVGCGSSSDDDCNHRDRDDDSICDKCDEELETDEDEDSNKECEHVDKNGNGKCDKCFKKYDKEENNPPISGGEIPGGGDNPGGDENPDNPDNPDDPDNPGGNTGLLEYTVVFSGDDGGIIGTQTVLAGMYITEPVEPEKEGYSFLGWFLGDTLWDFSLNKPESDIVLVAKWLPLPQEFGGLSDVEYEGDVIYVGNTAGVTGALASIGVPFNLGIQAAFAVYNAKGGFGGKTVALRHYDDIGDASSSVALMDKLINEDEIFAVVGNFGSYAVEANLDMLKENCVPMIYAAANVAGLYNEKAESDGDRCIFPVQPLGITEGRSLILRAFAPMYGANGKIVGGLSASKVGVIYSTDNLSQTMLEGIRDEAENCGLGNRVLYCEVNSQDYASAASMIKNSDCDVVIVTVTGNEFVSALLSLANEGFKGSVLTTFNNSAAFVFNDSHGYLTDIGKTVLYSMNVYFNAWMDVSDENYYYYAPNSNLYRSYKALGMVQNDINGKELGVPGFSEEYWTVAEDIYNYAAGVDSSSAFSMSYNSYAIAGYMAGSLFCQALEEMEAQGRTLTRKNLVEILESKEFDVPLMASLSYQNGIREGTQSFTLNVFYDISSVTGGIASASSAKFTEFVSCDELRMYLGK